MTKILMAALAAAAMATSAGAVTVVTSTPGPDNPAIQNVIFNFNSGAPAGLTGNYSITTGTTAQLAAAPLGDATPYLVVPGLGMGTGGTATLNLGNAYRSISFYWGSIDTYNNVTFFTGTGGTGTSLGTFAGNQIPGATADGAQATTTNNRRVNFDFGTATANSVVFNSTAIAFELDDIAGVAGGSVTPGVPEPTVWATLITGFALVGFSMRRRRITAVAN